MTTGQAAEQRGQGAAAGDVGARRLPPVRHARRSGRSAPCSSRRAASAPGQRVLDVAAGTGNVAIRAAEAGAEVVASDLTPENFAAGRREARARGVELDWVEADAESLPFADGEFDVVTSAFGAIFAPDHQAVADELVRVCRPGGTIGMVELHAGGPGGGLLRAVRPPRATAARRTRSPPRPVGQRAARARAVRRAARLAGAATRARTSSAAPSPAAYRAFFKETFGPVVGLYASLAASPRARRGARPRTSSTSPPRRTRARPAARRSTAYEYLLVVGRKALRAQRAGARSQRR